MTDGVTVQHPVGTLGATIMVYGHLVSNSLGFVYCYREHYAGEDLYCDNLYFQTPKMRPLFLGEHYTLTGGRYKCLLPGCEKTYGKLYNVKEGQQI